MPSEPHTNRDGFAMFDLTAGSYGGQFIEHTTQCGIKFWSSKQCWPDGHWTCLQEAARGKMYAIIHWRIRDCCSGVQVRWRIYVSRRKTRAKILFKNQIASAESLINRKKWQVRTHGHCAVPAECQVPANNNRRLDDNIFYSFYARQLARNKIYRCTIRISSSWHYIHSFLVLWNIMIIIK